MKLVQYNEYSICAVDTAGLVLKHQDVSSHSAEYASMRFHIFYVFVQESHTVIKTNHVYTDDSVSHYIAVVLIHYICYYSLYTITVTS